MRGHLTSCSDCSDWTRTDPDRSAPATEERQKAGLWGHLVTQIHAFAKRSGDTEYRRLGQRDLQARLDQLRRKLGVASGRSANTIGKHMKG